MILKSLRMNNVWRIRHNGSKQVTHLLQSPLSYLITFTVIQIQTPMQSGKS